MDLQIEEDFEFQRKEWRAQRIGWIALAAIVAAALAGLTGPGPLSHSTGRSSNGSLSVQYLRFTRAGGAAGMTVEAAPALVRDGTLTLQLDQAFVESFEIQQITPEPSQAAVDGDQVVYSFAVTCAGESVVVVFDLQPEAMGSVRGTVSAEDQVVEFRHFVYP